MNFRLYCPENLDTSLVLAKLNQLLDNRHKYKSIVQDTIYSMYPSKEKVVPIYVEVVNHEIVKIRYIETTFTCSICQENGIFDKHVTACNHTFHKRCLNEWFRRTECKTCPNCRQVLE